jgi:hypothetical protein
MNIHTIGAAVPHDLLTAIEAWEAAFPVASRSITLRQMLGVAATCHKLGLVVNGELRLLLSEDGIGASKRQREAGHD